MADYDDTGIASNTILNTAFDDDTGGIAVDMQDQTTPSLDFFFIQISGSPTTLSADAVKEDRTLSLTSTTGFVDGTYVAVFTGDGTIYFGTQQGAPDTGDITLDTPLDFAFPSGSTVVPLIRNMNVDGSSTAQTFFMQGPGVGDIDVIRLMVKMLTDGAVNLAKFGDLDALTNGCVLRRNNADGTMRNQWNIKTNGDLALLTFDYDPYQATNPTQGQDGALFRNTYGGSDKHGVVFRMI